MSTSSWESAIGSQILDLNLSDEDVEELRSERTIKHSNITSEELQKLTVDESLNPSERIVYLLREGEEIQKIHALSVIPEILISEEHLYSSIIQLVTDQLKCVSKDLLVATLICLKKMILKNMVKEIVIQNQFLPSLLDFLKSKRDRDIVRISIEIIEISMPFLQRSQSKELLLDFVGLNSSLTSTVITRESCCCLIRLLSQCLTEEMFCNKLLRVMKSLCQDIELEVRAAMCRQLENISLNLSGHILETIILPELYLLFQDEEIMVREAALTTLCNIFSRMEKEELIDSNLIDLILAFYKKVLLKNLSEEMSIAAQFLGRIFHSLSAYWNAEEKVFLIECFQAFSKHGLDENNNLFFSPQKSLGLQMDRSSECRCWCAFNFPALLSNVPLHLFEETLLPSFVLLCQDFNPFVRKCMASSFHEVAKILSRNEIHHIKPIFLRLLQDKDYEVLGALMKNLSNSLEYVMTSSQEPDLSQILSTLLASESYISQSLRWRIHMKLLKQLFIVEKYFTSDLLYTKVVPVLMEILRKNKALPVHHEAARTLLRFFRANRNIDERNAIHAKIIAELAQSSCYRKRMLFLDICEFVPEYFSKFFFKEYFYDSVMNMASDPVVNVRVKFCWSLILLKSQLQLPSDRLQLQLLEQIVRRLMALENDRDVSHAIRSVIIELDGMSVSMDDAKTAENLADKEKERDEQSILMDYNTMIGESHRKNSVDKNDHIRRARNSSFTNTKDTSGKKVTCRSSKTSATTSSPKQAASRSKESVARKTPSLNATAGSSSTSSGRLTATSKKSSHHASLIKRQGR